MKFILIKENKHLIILSMIMIHNNIIKLINNKISLNKLIKEIFIIFQSLIKKHAISILNSFKYI